MAKNETKTEVVGNEGIMHKKVRVLLKGVGTAPAVAAIG